jgi:hypothetical protein
MHSSARRARHPSDSSRAGRQQTRTRSSGRRTAAPTPRLARGPGSGGTPATVPGRRSGPERCHTRVYYTPGGDPASVTAPDRRRGPGPVPHGSMPVRGPAGPLDRAARRGAPGCHSGRQEDGWPECIATAGPGPGSGLGRRRWEAAPGRSRGLLARPPRTPCTAS